MATSVLAAARGSEEMAVSGRVYAVERAEAGGDELTVYVEVTSDVRKVIALASELTEDEKERLRLRQYLDGQTIPWRLLYESVKTVRKHSSSSGRLPWLHTICKGAEITFPKPLKKPRDPELDRRLGKIKEDLGNNAYAAMTHDVTSNERQAKQSCEYLASYREQAGLGLNVCVLMGTLFAAGYVLGAKASSHPTAPLLCGLVGSFAALLLETALFIIRASPRQTRRRQKQRPSGTVAVEKKTQ